MRCDSSIVIFTTLSFPWLNHGLVIDVVEVARGGGDVGVAELARDEADVEALAPQLRRVGVAQPVGVYALGDARRAGQRREQTPDARGGDRPAGGGSEDGRERRDERERRAGPQSVVCVLDPALVDAHGA